MLKQQEAMQQLDALRKASFTQRRFYEAKWAMNCVYDHGPQWGYLNAKNNELRLRFLSHITDPRRSDVRVALNRIHQDVVTMTAKTCPQQIRFSLNPSSIQYSGVQHAGTTMMNAYLEQIKAINVLRDKEPVRYVLGTSIVRRTLSMHGQPVQVGDNTLRTVLPRLALVYPCEIIRDPASQSLRPADDETIFCHEKPRTVEWVNRTFGRFLKEPVQEGIPMGQLMSYQRKLEASTGVTLNRGATESSVKSLMVYECYFQDFATNKPGGWPWVLFAYHSSTSDEEKTDLKPLFFGPNPFYGLPFHLYHYDTEISAPWARGIPDLQKDLQDVLNLGYTNLIRYLGAANGKIVFQEGTVEKPNEAFNNRLDTPIPWRKNSANDEKPTRLQGLDLNPAAIQVMSVMPGYLKDAISLDSVLQGKPAGKRGESGDALDARITQASGPLEKIRRDDDLTTQELLYGMGVDLAANLRFDVAQELLGPDVPEQIGLEFMRTPFTKAIKSVSIHQSMNRPQTPADTRADYLALSQAQIISPETALWELTLRGQDIDTAMMESYKKQTAEIQMMIDGQDVDPSPEEPHQYHIRTIEWFVAQPAYLNLPAVARERISSHWMEHKTALMNLQAADASINQISPAPGNPSPSSAAVEATLGMQGGTAGPPQ